jgi:uncharacterized membrane protein YfbV (UPF0208 family)
MFDLFGKMVARGIELWRKFKRAIRAGSTFVDGQTIRAVRFADRSFLLDKAVLAIRAWRIYFAFGLAPAVRHDFLICRCEIAEMTIAIG